MPVKKLYVVTSEGSYRYEIHESSGKYKIYKMTGGFFDDHDKVGEAKNLDDSLSIAKNHAPGSFKRFEFN